MTPKEKARDLFYKFKGFYWAGYDRNEEIPDEVSKECAIMLCEEIIAEFSSDSLVRIYYQEVIKEIQAL
jgi:hypothetical protein